MLSERREVDRIIDMRRRGMTYSEIADRLPISYGTVVNRVKEYYSLDLARLAECEECGEKFMVGDLTDGTNPGAMAQVAYCSYECKRSAQNRRNYIRRTYVRLSRANMTNTEFHRYRRAAERGYLRTKIIDGRRHLYREEVETYRSNPPGIGYTKGPGAWRKENGLSEHA